MRPAQAAGGREQTRAGAIMLAVISALSAVLVIAGLFYATGTAGRDQAALAAAGCEPGLSSEAQPCITQPMLASEYLAILTPATGQVNVDDGAYAADEARDLRAAEAALTAEVSADQAFDASLGGIRFPPAITPLAQALIRADQARARLLAEQARSSSLAQLRSFDQRVQASDAAVQADMRRLLRAIDAPVPDR